MTATPLYATLLALLFIANFAEYAPLALLLVFFVETDGSPKLWVHGLGIALLCGRVLHAWGVSQLRENFRYRVSGMVLTFSVIAAAGISILLARII